MADLISRAAAIAELMQMVKAHEHEIFRGELLYYTGIKAMLEAQPAVAAVMVVRCRDCKYGEPETNGRGEDMVMCQNKLNPIGDGDWLMPPEFYCADGERRDES